LFGNDDPGLPLVTCDAEATEKYVLGPAILVRSDFVDAVAEPNRSGGGNIVVLTVADSDRLAQVTGSNVGQRLAFALNGVVCSAPEVRGPDNQWRDRDQRRVR
jgi:preprotein translocase subunit SecD